MNSYYEKLKQGLTGAVTVAAAAARQTAEVAKNLAEEITSFKALKDYKLAGHVATAGPGGSWKIFHALNKKPGAVFAEVSVWILDKKSLTEQASRAGRARGFDQFFEQQRRSCNQMLRIKHPGVLKIIEPLEETNAQMVFVTEPVFGSLTNVLTQFREVPTAPDDRAGVSLTPLEFKYGLHILGETLHFLHHEAKLVHCNINPATIIVTRDGGWKLAGFEFVASINEFGGSAAAGGAGQLVFEYSSSHPSPWEEYAQPPLAHTSPELVGGSMASSNVCLSGAADCFSLATITYQLVVGQQLLPVGSSTGEYRSRMSNAGCWDMSGISGSLQPLLLGMLSVTASARPNAAAFSGCQWFQEDMLLRCLKFLDTIIQRDSGQKVAFLKDLLTFWNQFDDRLLQHRVLPPIVQEMRNEMVALAALPVVLAIMARMKPQGFAASGILPVLRPVFEQADGEVLLALVRHLGVFYNLMPSDAHASVLVPLMLRAFDSNNTRAQEETLKALQQLAPDMSYNLLREQLTPRVVGLCLRTTSLVVRVAALALMAQAAHRLDKEAAASMLEVCSQIVAVDRSAGTAMAVLRLGDAIGKHYGPEVTAVRVLPLLSPLLMCPGLNNQQFQAYITTLRSLLDKVAEKRAGEVPPAAEAVTAAAPTGAGTASGGVLSGSSWMDDGSSGRSPAAAAGQPMGWSSSSTTTMKPTVVSTSSMNSLTASWDTSAAALSSSSGAATTSSTWIGSSSTAAGAGSSLPSSSLGWSSTATTQQQQRLSGGSSGGIGTGIPAPDIFSSSTTDMLAGLSTGSPLKAGGSGSATSSNGLHQSGGAGMDLFGGGLGAASNLNSNIAMQQQQKPVQLQPTFRAHPSASTSAGSLGGTAASSSSHDPFAALTTGSTSHKPMAAAAAPGQVGGFDPFSSLAAAPPAAKNVDDLFAGLSSNVGSSGKAMASQQRQQQQQQHRPQQQQQQQWSGTDSLI